MSRASYAALVVAQIQARKFYPANARAGAVVFSLAIGSSGTVTQFRITRSSGSDVLDQAARQIVTSIHPPPPPGGSFSGSATLRFDMLR
jgi:protein TonB